MLHIAFVHWCSFLLQKKSFHPKVVTYCICQLMHILQKKSLHPIYFTYCICQLMPISIAKESPSNRIYTIDLSTDAHILQKRVSIQKMLHFAFVLWCQIFYCKKEFPSKIFYILHQSINTHIQTWHKASLYDGKQSFCKLKTIPFSKRW